RDAIKATAAKLQNNARQVVAIVFIFDTPTVPESCGRRTHISAPQTPRNSSRAISQRRRRRADASSVPQFDVSHRWQMPRHLACFPRQISQLRGGDLNSLDASRATGNQRGSPLSNAGEQAGQGVVQLTLSRRLTY